MHRVICPAPKEMVVDHINRNPLDNRKVNLRVATPMQNTWNRKFRKKGGRSRYNGIQWHESVKKWQVLVMNNGRSRSYGYYADEVEAAKVYDEVVAKHRGEYACLNFPKK